MIVSVSEAQERTIKGRDREIRGSHLLAAV
jgi:hypothetical protein